MKALNIFIGIRENNSALDIHSNDWRPGCADHVVDADDVVDVVDVDDVGDEADDVGDVGDDGDDEGD